MWNFDQIVSHLQGLVREWTVEVPSSKVNELDEEDSSLAAKFPPEDKKVVKMITGQMKSMGCDDPSDLLAGSCEPLALLASDYAEELVSHCAPHDRHGVRQIADQLHYKAVDALNGMAPQEAAKRVFQSLADNHWCKGPNLWGGPARGKPIEEYLYGTREFDKHFVRATASNGTVPVSRMPMYLLNYIFDGDELSDGHMIETGQETAQFSLHVVGLVFDHPSQRVIVADPNGGLIPGSNMEFLSIPVKPRKLPPQFKGQQRIGSTCLSAYDIHKHQLSLISQ
jgi:hypothetical protein